MHKYHPSSSQPWAFGVHQSQPQSHSMFNLGSTDCREGKGQARLAEMVLAAVNNTDSTAGAYIWFPSRHTDDSQTGLRTQADALREEGVWCLAPRRVG